MSGEPKNPKMNSVHSEDAPIQEPNLVDEQTWLTERQKLLAAEKDVLRAYDAMIALRRKLPWHVLNKDYTFETVDGHDVKLSDLVSSSPTSKEDKINRPLVLQHFMWPVGWDKGCSSCSLWTDTISGYLPHLNAKADFVAVINAPSAEKFKEFLAVKKWPCRIVRAKNYDFGHDFGVSQTVEEAEAGKTMLYNFKESSNPFGTCTELPGFTVFVKNNEGKLCRTFGVCARGLEPLTSLWATIDMLPQGRQGWHPSHREEYGPSVPSKPE